MIDRLNDKSGREYRLLVRTAAFRDTEQSWKVCHDLRGVLQINRTSKKPETNGLLVSFLTLDGPLDLASGFACLNGFSPVVQFFPLRQSELEFRAPPLVEIQTEWDERQSFLLRLAEQLVDFFLVQKQLPYPHWIVIHHVAVAVRADMAMMEKDLSIAHRRIAVQEIHTSVTKRFDLGA